MNLSELVLHTYRAFTPPKRQTVSEWADENRVLVSESSSEPGQWRTSRAPYQQAPMDAFTQAGIWKIVLMACSQVGKALDIDTPIPTPNGWTRMKDIRVGDRVYDENGQETIVTAATDIMLGHDCYRVKFSDKTQIVADAEHRWKVESYHNFRFAGCEILTTEEMMPRYKQGKTNAFAIPVAMPLQCKTADLPIPPYTLGVWLGDGHSYSGCISINAVDTEILNGIHAEGVETTDRGIKQNTLTVILDSRFSSKSATMFSRLKAEGLLRDKHIPTAYQRADQLQRTALLQGIMDTDGSIRKDGRCEITLSVKRLAEDVAELIIGLGMKCIMREKRAVCTNSPTKAESTVYRIGFMPYQDFAVFRLRRKADMQCSRESEGKSGGRRRPGEATKRRIVGIEKVESRPVKCIAVDSANHLYLAGKAMIPTHNTELELNMMGRAIDIDPGPILFVQPTDKFGEDFSKRRVAPMIKACKPLQRKVYEAKSRDAGNTITMKTFPGGSVTFAGANSPTELAGRPVRYEFMDEIDRFPRSAGSEGDPVEIAIKRTETFRHNRKIVLTSTPTIKGVSKIEREYMSGTQEEWHVQCSHCKTFSYIRFADIKFEKTEFSNEHGETEYHVDNVWWRCPICKRDLGEYETKRTAAKWVAKNPKAADNGVRSFRLNAFMSPWSDWKSIVLSFLRAKDDPELLKVFFNTILGETWEMRDRSGIPEKIHARREHYNAEVPTGVLVLTMGIDTQDNRLEYEIVGWSRDEESWGISRGVIPGRADSDGVWDEVDMLLEREWKMKDGGAMRVLATFVDSGGHFTQEIYRECLKRAGKRVWAIKGEGGEGKAYVRMMKSGGKNDGVKFIISVDSGKEAILHATTIEEAGPRFMHFPINSLRGYDLDYFRGLISEKMVVHRRAGKSVIAWEKIYERNEPLDCRNYARAAYKYFNWHFDQLEAVLSGKNVEKPVTKAQIQKRKSKYVVSSGIKV